MFEKEEKKLTDFRKKYEDVSIPVEALDLAIMNGFKKAKHTKKTRFKKWGYACVATFIFFGAFFTTIRISPAFASYIASIPGMEGIVELISHDKGKLAAISNEYYQEVGVSEKKNGVQLTIDGAIADENGIVLFYSLKPEKKYEWMGIDKVNLKNLDGEELNQASLSYGPPFIPENSSTYNGMIEYFFKEPYDAQDFQLDLTLEADGYSQELSMPFSLKENIKAAKQLPINKDVTMEGQKVTFIRAEIYPLRTALHIKRDPNNTKKILNFDDLRLVDENGEIWSKISNGISGSRISDDEEIVYLQSNYFNEPKELYLEFNKIQAIDKDEAELVVDIERERIIKQPKGNSINPQVSVSGNDLIFSMRTKEEFSYFMFNTPKDREGNDLDSYAFSTSNIGDEDNPTYEQRINIQNLHSVKGPISFELSFYPSWIVGSEKIKIK
ncbi:DUF4179 domain-containing protein [Bacillus niameyensis]|uniref:DUF4179 domain-containing protein n=1 Tax=Bacillus niameyensis TaxID=1522308 RepID=UPI000785E0A2|nr:DUF4179 domain-containing protein [Bacillus niameyensis]